MQKEVYNDTSSWPTSKESFLWNISSSTMPVTSLKTQWWYKVLTTYTKEVRPLGTVTISILRLIRLRILQGTFPESTLSSQFCYIYFRWRIYSTTASLLHMCLYLYVCASYTGVCIVLLVYVIKYNCWLYLILVFCSTYSLCLGYSTTAPFFHLFLYEYVCEYYICV